MTAAPARNDDANANDRAPIELPQRERIEILIAVLAGIFLAALDQTVVGTALPHIVSDLRGNDVYIWPFTSYLVTATVSGPLYGKLSDLFGRRLLFTIGVGIFLIGSALSGLSQTMAQFIAFRGLQGLGAGALFPISIAIIGDIFSPSERGKYLGFFGAVFGLSSIIGPAIGGLITDNIGWQWIFFVNLPIGAVVLYVIFQILPLLLGLIVSAIAAGQIVARTGRFKALIACSLVVVALGLFLLTNLRTDTSAPLVWLWMAITGIGVGPSFAIFTLVVQNNVPPRELGTATRSLTLFQQVGGTVGLAIAGSIFGSVLLDEMPRQIQAAGVPADLAARFAQGGGAALNNFGGVGDLGASILANVPEQARAQVQPLIPAIVHGIHEAFSIATASTFVLGIGTALLAALVVLVLMPATRMHVASSQPAMAPPLPPGELE